MVKQRRRNVQSAESFDLPQLDQIFSYIQVGILVAAALIVPLVVFPEKYFVDITSTPKTTFLRMLGTLQAGVLLSRLVISLSPSARTDLVLRLNAIRSNRPAALILGSILAVAVISVISTLFSILPGQSWWGRVPAGFESGGFTGLMYVILSISAFISVHSLVSQMWFWRTISITAVLAGLVGSFQFLGWSPLDISTTHSVRLTGTNGNPIFFGAMLAILAPVAVGYLLYSYQASSEKYRSWWLASLAGTSLVLSVSLFGTVSRGPWVGALASGLVAAILIAIYGRDNFNLKPIAVSLLFITFGGLLVTFVDPTPPENVDGESTSSSATSSAVAGAGRTSTLDLRIRYWKLSAEMASHREPVPYTSDSPKVVRLLFGYGPDMFRFAGTYFADNTTFTRRLTAAHNDPINRLVEQGILGLLAWMTLWGAIAYGCYTLVRRTGTTLSNPTAWIPITLFAAFTARFVEQLFGSPTPGGVLVFWLLTGALAAMLMRSQTIARKNERPEAVSSRTKSSPLVLYGAYFGVAIITIAAFTLAWDKGASYLIASQLASYENRPVITGEEAIDRLEKATELAPDVAGYWHKLAQLEHGRVEVTENPIAIASARTKAYEYDRTGYETNPMEVDSIYRLAFSAFELGKLGQSEFNQEAVSLYERLTEIIPSDTLAKERLQQLNDYLNR